MGMQWQSIGRLGDYIKQSQLKLSAKHKIKTGQALNFDKKKDEAGIVAKMLESAKKEGTQLSDSLKTAVIKDKLSSGRKLSEEELRYLKGKDESLYRKAKKAQEAREDLERDLRNARTKAEARNALTRAQLKVAGEAMAEISAAKASLQGGGGMAGAGAAGGAAASDGAGNASSGGAAQAGSSNGSGDAAEGNGGIMGDLQKAASDLPPEAQNMLGGILKDINSSLAAANEVNKEAAEGIAGGSGVSGAEASVGDSQADGATEDSGAVDGAGREDESTSATDPKQEYQQKMLDILEELLYKMKAIQKTWEEFTSTKAYREMPENYMDKGKKETISAVDVFLHLNQEENAARLMKSQPLGSRLDIKG